MNVFRVTMVTEGHLNLLKENECAHRTLNVTGVRKRHASAKCFADVKSRDSCVFSSRKTYLYQPRNSLYVGTKFKPGASKHSLPLKLDQNYIDV